MERTCVKRSKRLPGPTDVSQLITQFFWTDVHESYGLYFKKQIAETRKIKSKKQTEVKTRSTAIKSKPKSAPKSTTVQIDKAVRNVHDVAEQAGDVLKTESTTEIPAESKTVESVAAIELTTANSRESSIAVPVVEGNVDETTSAPAVSSSEPATTPSTGVGEQSTVVAEVTSSASLTDAVVEFLTNLVEKVEQVAEDEASMVQTAATVEPVATEAGQSTTIPVAVAENADVITTPPVETTVVTESTADVVYKAVSNVQDLAEQAGDLLKTESTTELPAESKTVESVAAIELTTINSRESTTDVPVIEANVDETTADFASPVNTCEPESATTPATEVVEQSTVAAGMVEVTTSASLTDAVDEFWADLVEKVEQVAEDEASMVQTAATIEPVATEAGQSIPIAVAESVDVITTPPVESMVFTEYAPEFTADEETAMGDVFLSSAVEINSDALTFLESTPSCDAIWNSLYGDDADIFADEGAKSDYKGYTDGQILSLDHAIPFDFFRGNVVGRPPQNTMRTEHAQKRTND